MSRYQRRASHKRTHGSVTKAGIGLSVATLTLPMAAAMIIGLESLPVSAQSALDPLPSALASASPGTVVIPPSSRLDSAQVGSHARTHFQIFNPNPPLSAATVAKAAVAGPNIGPPYSGYNFETPASLACVYNLVTPASGCNPNVFKTVPTGGSRAIALVDAYHYPSAFADLVAFSAQFGLPQPTKATSGCAAKTFHQICPAGQSCTTSDPFGWNIEAALDIQWAHAMAPNAAIFLVEATDNSYTNLGAAVLAAGTLLKSTSSCKGGQISMSWGGDEFSDETSIVALNPQAGVTYFASTGDQAGTEFPSVLPQVVAVGGTSVRRSATFQFLGESAWIDTGGGISRYVARPSYQNSISGRVGAMRGVPDVAAAADPRTPAWVYQSGAGGWFGVGGTSWASPTVAGITNNAGTFRTGTGEQAALYAAPANLMDIAGGFCGFYVGDAASAGWDRCTGLGSPGKGKAGF